MSTEYIYDCKICSREVRASNLIKCDICERRICNNCNKGGFCLDHYNLLTPEGKYIYDKKLENTKEILEKLNKYMFFFSGLSFLSLFLMIFLPLFLVKILEGIAYTVMLVFAFLLILFFFITVFFEKKGIKKKEELKKERVNIYMRHHHQPLNL